MGGENRLHKVASWLPHLCAPWHVHPNTELTNVNKIKYLCFYFLICSPVGECSTTGRAPISMIQAFLKKGSTKDWPLRESFIVFIRNTQARLVRWFSGQRHLLVGLMTQAQPLDLPRWQEITDTWELVFDPTCIPCTCMPISPSISQSTNRLIKKTSQLLNF